MYAHIKWNKIIGTALDTNKDASIGTNTALSASSSWWKNSIWLLDDIHFVDEK